MNKHSIILICQENFNHDFLERLSGAVAQEFHLPVMVEKYKFDFDKYFNPDRCQYDADGLMNKISELPLSPNSKKIGVLQVDLFIPILTYIFGQAMLNNCAGVASLYRLKNEYYGLTGDDELLFNRFLKIVTHEIGHMFGLIHCHVPDCVMQSSTYVEDVDQKSHHFCKECRKNLNAGIL